MSLIELDDYLDLSDLESVNDEFSRVIDSLSEQWGVFYAVSREVDDEGNYLKDNLQENIYLELARISIYISSVLKERRRHVACVMVLRLPTFLSIFSVTPYS